MSRTVVILCGPPGAGKTTAARQSGLTVYDRDDPHWQGERHFTDELLKLAADPHARAVVIRSGATSYARARAAELVKATHVMVMMADKHELVARIRRRGRPDAVRTIAGVDTWLQRFERQDRVKDFTGWAAIQEPDLGVSSEDW